MAKDQLGQLKTRLLKKAKSGDFQSLGRLLSIVETDVRGSAPFLSKLEGSPRAVRLGITGPPGAGKSTLVSHLVKGYRSANLKVAVLAVDPSSPFSGGAILGDRIRMGIHSDDAKVFIRSIGSRGGLGGLSVATGAMATVFENTGFDIVLIETVGVGQTELQVMNLADATAVVLVPESGDVIQTMKAGILEIADLFVVNKADRSGSESLAQELRVLVELDGADARACKRDVLLTSAISSNGVEDFGKKLLTLARGLKTERRQDPDRLRAELKNLVLWSLQEKLQKKIASTKVKNVYSSLAKFR